jgi:hypothetical protein
MDYLCMPGGSISGAKFAEIVIGEVLRIPQPVEKVVIGPVGSPKPHPNT